MTRQGRALKHATRITWQRRNSKHEQRENLVVGTQKWLGICVWLTRRIEFQIFVEFHPLENLQLNSDVTCHKGWYHSNILQENITKYTNHYPSIQNILQNIQI